MQYRWVRAMAAERAPLLSVVPGLPAQALPHLHPGEVASPASHQLTWSVMTWDRSRTYRQSVQLNAVPLGQYRRSAE